MDTQCVSFLFGKEVYSMNYRKEGSDIVIEHEGKTFYVHTNGIKRKKLLKVAKVMKKHKDSAEILTQALQEAGISVSVKEDGHGG